ncbi:SMP-30/gluconolactonase/LRE family protein [Paraburkholderia phenazinium]|uniref:SMP-30/Gluconolaconase/LRE-like region-containing protein n=1 Tax=Paraburkholderia phenazinium TaxID=60549 RepID=A0A1G7RGN6_9BURK|nr:SMP-30/gluconolactonase/LRE family protein [Paraburkholderia phenazinium]SDG09911.1 SMP-30/Gluconolaconase/LRE-like region-containing protein [Paraburkholderia phenazinium]
MVQKQIRAALLGVLIVLSAANALIASPCQAQYSTDWLANTFGTLATHVGNTARSMWVAPEGVIYTASFWDESEGGVAIYQNGASIGSIGIHSEFQGGAITGNATSIFAALQYSTSYGSGSVGRYNRVTQKRDLVIPVSVWNAVSKADVITGLATAGSLLYASDFFSNRVRVFTTDGVWQQDMKVSTPGALAVDSAGNIWVAQKNAAAIAEFSPGGAPLNIIQMPAASRPSALYFDASSGQLMVGDEGPDMNIKLYNVSGTPALAGTFGVQGGYLDTTSGIKGQVGDKRFTRIVGIGKDAAGNLYVLNNPWGGAWDLGRNGGTDIHAYNSAGALQWQLQSLNFEALAAPDPSTDGAYFYGGTNIYTGSAGGTFVANTVDPFDYPSDPRLNMDDTQRDEHFGQLVTVGGNRILVATGQNPGIFYFFHFNPANGYIAIPDASIPGPAFNTTLQVTGGFCIDSRGDVWASVDRTNRIYHYPLTGFDGNGKPTWGAGIVTSIPESIRPLTRIIYLADTDTMILAQGVAGSWDWTAMKARIEVYHGWSAGNISKPDPVINLTSANPKSITAAGNYLFVGYVHTVPNVDAFNLTTGQLDTTLINSSPVTVDVGNDVDSMYGLRAYLRSDGVYVVTKDNYNGSSVVVYRWMP